MCNNNDKTGCPAQCGCCYFLVFRILDKSSIRLMKNKDTRTIIKVVIQASVSYVIIENIVCSV